MLVFKSRSRHSASSRVLAERSDWSLPKRNWDQTRTPSAILSGLGACSARLDPLQGCSFAASASTQSETQLIPLPPTCFGDPRFEPNQNVIDQRRHLGRRRLAVLPPNGRCARSEWRLSGQTESVDSRIGRGPRVTRWQHSEGVSVAGCRRRRLHARLIRIAATAVLLCLTSRGDSDFRP